MCSSKVKQQTSANIIPTTKPPQGGGPQIDGRPVLQPKSNLFPTLERRNSLKKNSSPNPKSPTLKPLPLSPPVSPTAPKLKSPRPSSTNPPGNDSNKPAPATPARTLRKVASFNVSSSLADETLATLSFPSSLIVEVPGTIAAARREHVAVMQEQRKLRTAHYGRTKSCKFVSSSLSPVSATVEPSGGLEAKR